MESTGIKAMNKELVKFPYFVPHIEAIMGKPKVESRRSVSQRPAELSPGEKLAEIGHLKGIADVAPERMAKVFDAMKTGYYAVTMQEFLKTEYGKDFEKYLKGKLQKKGETDGKDG
jgi:hypothetical protein